MAVLSTGVAGGGLPGYLHMRLLVTVVEVWGQGVSNEMHEFDTWKKDLD